MNFSLVGLSWYLLISSTAVTISAGECTRRTDYYYFILALINALVVNLEASRKYMNLFSNEMATLYFKSFIFNICSGCVCMLFGTYVFWSSREDCAKRLWWLPRALFYSCSLLFTTMGGLFLFALISDLRGFVSRFVYESIWMRPKVIPKVVRMQPLTDEERRIFTLLASNDRSMTPLFLMYFLMSMVESLDAGAKSVMLKSNRKCDICLKPFTLQVNRAAYFPCCLSHQHVSCAVKHLFGTFNCYRCNGKIKPQLLSYIFDYLKPIPQPAKEKVK